MSNPFAALYRFSGFERFIDFKEVLNFREFKSRNITEIL
jgi:hypothetical protein